MKRLFTIIAFLFLCLAKSYAQQIADTADFKKHLGKIVTLCETVSTIKIVSDTLTLLNMGRAYPKQKYTIAIKSNRISLDWGNLKGKHICVTGVISIYKDQLEIVVMEPKQITVEN